MLKVVLRRGELVKEGCITVHGERREPLLNVFLSSELGSDVPERADVVIKDGRIHLVPEREKDERLFLIDAIEVYCLAHPKHSVSVDKELTTADIQEMREESGWPITTMAYAAIFNPGDRVVSTKHGHFRRVVSFNEEHVLEVYNIDCRDRAKFPH